VVESEVGAPDRFDQQIAVERAAGVSTLPGRFDTKERERGFEPANNRGKSPALVRRPRRERLRRQIAIDRTLKCRLHR